MSVFREFRSQLADVEGSDVEKLTFTLDTSGSLSVFLVGQLKRWSCVLVFDSVLHFSFTAVPDPVGLWLLDRLLVEEKAPGPGPLPLGLEVGMNFPAAEEPALLCLRTFGEVELEIVAAQATAYFEPKVD